MPMPSSSVLLVCAGTAGKRRQAPCCAMRPADVRSRKGMASFVHKVHHTGRKEATILFTGYSNNMGQSHRSEGEIPPADPGFSLAPSLIIHARPHSLRIKSLGYDSSWKIVCRERSPTSSLSREFTRGPDAGESNSSESQKRLVT